MEKLDKRAIQAYLEVDRVGNSVLEDGGLAGWGRTLVGGFQEGCEANCSADQGST